MVSLSVISHEKMKKTLLILATLIFNMFGLFGQSKNKLNFTKEFFEELKLKVPGITLVNLKDLEIQTMFEDEEHTHFLDNAYNEYGGEEKYKKEVIERYVNSSVELYKPKPSFSIDQVVPVIKPQRYINEILRLTDQQEISLLYEKYNSELFIFYARDLENSISYISKEDAINYRLKIDGLRKIAIDNLMSKVSIERNGSNGYYMLTTGGDYEASLLLELSIWTKENFDVKGEIVIGVPSRDMLMITGSEDELGLEKLLNLIKEIYNSGSYVISDKMFILKDGIFETWRNVNHER